MLNKSVVLYMDEHLINNAPASYDGASCEKCVMFLSDTSECEILDPAKVDKKGVCGFFIGGSPSNSNEKQPHKLVPAEVAGYIKNGPTLCGSCTQFVSPSSCKVVEGDIEYGGCCNGWTGKNESKQKTVKPGMTTNQTRQYLESDSDYD